jgi:hypothetical protein
MARFCTKCGASVADDALFCDACGNPMRQPAAAAAVSGSAETTPVASTPRISRRALTIGAVAAAILVVAAGGMTWWMAPESASEASFTRAVNEYYATHAEASERLLCLNDLPYSTNQIRVAEYDSRTRKWMDTLSRAGVYAEPATETVGQFLVQTQYVYQLTEDGKKSVRNNRLCLGSKITATKVTGFDQVQSIDGQRMAQATATVGVADEAPWLSKSPDRPAILEQTRRQDIDVEFPLTIVEGKWKVADAASASAQATAGYPGRAAGASGNGRAVSPASDDGIFASIKKLLSFGKKNPLIGKWRDESGMARLEFTDNGMIENGIVRKASFEVNGDEVTLKPEGVGGVGMVFKIHDSNTMSLDVGIMAMTFRRVK